MVQISSSLLGNIAIKLVLSLRTCCAILSEWDPSPVLRTPSPTKGRGDKSWPLLGLSAPRVKWQRSWPPLPSPLPRGAREHASLRPYANPLSLRGARELVSLGLLSRSGAREQVSFLPAFGLSIPLLVRFLRLPPPRERFSNLVSHKSPLFLIHFNYNILDYSFQDVDYSNNALILSKIS